MLRRYNSRRVDAALAVGRRMLASRTATVPWRCWAMAAAAAAPAAGAAFTSGFVARATHARAAMILAGWLGPGDLHLAAISA